MNDYLFEEAPELIYAYYDPEVAENPQRNLVYRQKVAVECDNDVYFREETLNRCAVDSLFWVSTFINIFEPRPKPKVIPFVPWPHQIPVWKEMERWLGVRDVGLEKSRGQGASWMIILLCLHRWLFSEMFAAGFVSKDEATLDNPDSPGSLFGKLDFLLGNSERAIKPHLPQWMIPRFLRIIANHTFKNLENGSEITGFSSTGNVGTGDRKTVFVLDELAKFPRGDDENAMNSTFPVSDCRYLISSPFGPDGAYYKAMHSDSNMIKVRLHWSDNPFQNRGMYKVQIDVNDKRRVKLLDHKFWKDRAQSRGANCRTDYDVELLAEDILDESAENPFGYGFMLTGPYVKHELPRSPWYDAQCRRANQTPTGIAQELDIDYGGSSSRFFDINVVIRAQKRCEPVLWKGDMKLPQNPTSHHELEKCPCEPSYGGRIFFWRACDDFGRLQLSHSCVVGADVSAGTSGIMTSNSTLCVLDRALGEQVAALAAHNIPPEQFAEYSVALCYYLRNPDGVPAYLIWDATGSTGQMFGKRIADLGYPHIYLRETSEEMFGRETAKMGFWITPKTKGPLLGELRRALDRDEITLYDRECLEEAKYYVNVAGDKIEHVAQLTEKDPAASQHRHGDRVIAAALAWHLAKEYVLTSSGSVDDTVSAMEVPPNCAIARRRRYLADNVSTRAWVPPSQRRR